MVNHGRIYPLKLQMLIHYYFVNLEGTDIKLLLKLNLYHTLPNYINGYIYNFCKVTKYLNS